VDYCQFICIVIPNLLHQKVLKNEMQNYPVEVDGDLRVAAPYLAIANKQAEIMIRIASEFGFTPASRSRITTGGPPLLPLFESLDQDNDG
jgi:hypothetical protein